MEIMARAHSVGVPCLYSDQSSILQVTQARLRSAKCAMCPSVPPIWEPGGGGERAFPPDRRGGHAGRGRPSWARAQRIPFPNDWVQLVAGLSGAFCFAMIFGGTLRAGLAAAVAGLAANGYLLLCERLHLPGGFRKITTASLITLVCLPLCHLLGTEASHAIIGTLMILTPGIAFTMGIRDFVQGDYLSGTIRMIDALLVAACIAIGTGFVLWCYSLLTGVNIA